MRQRRPRNKKGASRPRWRPSIESLESRRVLSGIPLGALPDDTAEYLLGRVAVTPVFFESNGTVDPESQDWTSQEIDGVLQKIREGMDWWVDTLATLDTVHSLEFVYDDSFARDPVETRYEPIDRTSDFFGQYVSDWLTDVGYGEENSLEGAMRAFNHEQRVALDADWAFTVVVVDSSDDPDGQFGVGGSFGQAFAFAGGLFMVVPSTRPASTFAHEMGHIFWARDEYNGGGSWTDHRGYYNTQNWNAADNPTPGFQQQPSIMSSGLVLAEAYANHVSPASTLAFVGWQDSDGDGIFDVLDVPLHLEGSGHYDAASGLYTFDGAAWAVALESRNPASLGNDVTLNRISRIEYSVDGSPFVTATAPDSQRAGFSFAVPVASDFQSIRIRAVDAATGITSPVIEATATEPAASDAAAGGYAFLDENHSGVWEADEPLLGGLNARVTAVAGRDSLPGGSIDPADHAPGALPSSFSGVTLSAEGPYNDGRTGVMEDPSLDDRHLLAFYNGRLGKWETSWSSLDALVADFDEPTSEVRIDVVGIEADSLARMEAYDSEGQYLFRTTSKILQPGDTDSLRLEDPENRIASVRLFGHARTEVALGRLEWGPQWEISADAHGVFRFENLPDGVYQVALEPQLVIHQPVGQAVENGTVEVTVSGGQSPALEIAHRRVDSPWYNGGLEGDVDGNGQIEPLDALRVINDLNRHGSRTLSAGEPNTGFIDTNNDGWVTPTDALGVINVLNQQLRAGGEGSEPAAASRTVAAPTHSSVAIPLENSSLTAEGEDDQHQQARNHVISPRLTRPTPPAAWAVDAIFSDGAPLDDRFAGAGESSGEGEIAGEDEAAEREATLNSFFSEPFASRRF